jgi:hypothetical protein
LVVAKTLLEKASSCSLTKTKGTELLLVLRCACRR